MEATRGTRTEPCVAAYLDVRRRVSIPLHQIVMFDRGSTWRSSAGVRICRAGDDHLSAECLRASKNDPGLWQAQVEKWVAAGRQRNEKGAEPDRPPAPAKGRTEQCWPAPLTGRGSVTASVLQEPHGLRLAVFGGAVPDAHASFGLSVAGLFGRQPFTCHITFLCSWPSTYLFGSGSNRSQLSPPI